MSTQIFKYQLTGTGSIELPKGAGILSVQVINNIPFIYALVNSDLSDETETKHIEVFATGDSLDEEIQYRFIGTYTITKTSENNASVLRTHVGHVFEVLPQEVQEDVDLIKASTALDNAFIAYQETPSYYQAFISLLRNGLPQDQANDTLKSAFDAGYNIQ